MEIVVILVIALIVLGPQRLPDTARSIGRGMREFKDSLSSVEPDYEDEDEDEDEERDALDEPATARRA